jgi:membrane associated rhomboid family serine protease
MQSSQEVSSNDKKIFRYSLILPVSFLLAIWLVKIIEISLDVQFSSLGIYPRKLSGLVGIILTPFLHGDLKHLMANSVPLLVLGTGTIFFYRSLSYRVFLIIWIISGVCVWIGGRPSYHIGASGLVYGLAAFLFVSGAIRRDTRLAAISFIVIFLYGGMIWGVLPIWPAISWEGHLFGGAAGLACAIAYRHEGPKRKVYNWELEDDSDNDPFLPDEPNTEPSQQNCTTPSLLSDKND